MRPTTRRTQGATTSTAGNATGQVVTQLLHHCAGNPAPIPWAVARTKADTMATIMAESSAPKRIGAKRAEIRISISVKKYKSSRPNKRWCGGPPSRRVQEVDDPAGGIKAKPENPESDEALKPGGGRARRAARGDTGTHARLHHQERQRDGSEADRKRRPDRWVTNPREAPDAKQDGRKRYADQVVGGPAAPALAVHGKRGRDGIVATAPASHMGEPEANQAKD